MEDTTRLMIISGSLRPKSSTHAVIDAVIEFVRKGIEIDCYNEMNELPHFDDSNEVIISVEEFRRRLRASTAVLICSPEYAFGVPGSLKNALDWTVSSGEFNNMPTGIICMGISGENAFHSLMLTMKALGAAVDGEATLIISYIKSKIKEGEVNDPSTLENIKHVIGRLTDFSIERKKLLT